MIFEKQIVAAYKKTAYTRCDDTGCVFYFDATDFEGLKKEPFSFTAAAGHRLSGYVYSYEGASRDRIVVFDHGFGGGHRAYMKEIELLCREGYRVLAYDHTGCMESGGENTGGMAQSLCDLNDCILALKADAAFSGADISVIGHSWGGFSTLNITALHPDISHVVVFSGFVSVKLLIDSYFSGIMKGYRRAVMALEEQSNPVFVKYDARQTLKETEARVLLIYSDDDKKCPRSPHYDALYNSLSGKENISFMLLHGKGHNPNYTADAVSYLNKFFSELTRRKRNGSLNTEEQRADFVASFDWNRMTEQDSEVWAAVFEALKE
ncbi:MAG: alpha/beta fold hydrolase [Clostridia bacterium]|nr:alpha/beta fold hydrolase [Clostridia bacterium]